MKVFVIYYRIQGKNWLNNFTVEARTRESAVRKTKRKITKMYGVSDEEVIIKSVGVIGYM